MGFSLFGGGSSQSKTDPSFVFEPQAALFPGLFNDARSLADQQMGQVGGVATGLSEQLFGQGGDFLAQLGGGASTTLQPFLDPGFAGQQINSLEGILQRSFEQGINTLNANAIDAGALGGSRNQIAQGTALGDKMLALEQGASNILTADLFRRQEAAGTIESLEAQSAIGGINSLGGLFDLGFAPFAAEFSPLLNFANILGAPTVLSGGSTSSQSSSTGALNDLGGFMNGVGSLAAFG